MKTAKCVAIIAAGIVSAAAVGQCPQIVSGYARPGTDDYVKAIAAWDPAGTGFPKMVIGGVFTKAGGIFSGGTAVWDGTSLTALKNPAKTGIDGTVNAIAIFNGEVIAAGTFTTINTTTACNRIARWNGADWVVMGSGFDANVFSLAVHGGELYVGGLFSNSGATAAAKIAKWNGTGFVPLGSGIVGSVASMSSWNGKLYVGGSFANAGGVPSGNIAAWDGSTWSAPPTGVNGGVYAVVGAFDGLYVGGTFTAAAGNAAIKYLAKYTNPGGTHVWATPVEIPTGPYARS